jgi:ubiquinone/menaquinone biosynthesis C-methylase UbiE
MDLKPDRIYPDSGVELKSFMAKNYDLIMNVATLGLYNLFIHNVIREMNIQGEDKILDLGCGTGRNTGIMSKYLNNRGKITGMDVSPIMEKKFHKKFNEHKNINFIRHRIDVPFELPERYDKILISFVIHGFPHEVRLRVLENIDHHLKSDGVFLMLDFAEFDMNEMPLLYRLIFKSIECKYAFDFIQRDWKEILSHYNFSGFKELFFVKNYVRLLRAEKSLPLE